MRKKLIFACILATSMIVLKIDKVNAFVGTSECNPYQSEDTREQPPKASITSASFFTKGSGYILSLKMNNGRENIEIPLNAKLHLISARKISYTYEPLKISPNGKFSVTILNKSNTCTYKGTAKISPEASAKLFRIRNLSSQ